MDYRLDTARLSNFWAQFAQHCLADDVFGPIAIFEIPVNDAADSGLKVNAGLPIKNGLRLGDVSPGGIYVNGRAGEDFDSGFLAQGVFDERNEVAYLNRPVAAQVDYLMAEGSYP